MDLQELSYHSMLPHLTVCGDQRGFNQAQKIHNQQTEGSEDSFRRAPWGLECVLSPDHVSLGPAER